MNLIFAELGWIEKIVSGWGVTRSGRVVGGRQFEDDVKGNTYVKFPGAVLDDSVLKRGFGDNPNEKEGLKCSKLVDKLTTRLHQIISEIDFRQLLRRRTGTRVRSRAEVIIDNALDGYKLAHAYERRLPIEEDLYSDFFIPQKMFISNTGEWKTIRSMQSVKGKS